jgi:hypothetical protein
VEVLKGDEGKVVGMRFVNLCLGAKYKDNPLHNETEGGRVSILELGMMVEKGEW